MTAVRRRSPVLFSRCSYIASISTTSSTLFYLVVCSPSSPSSRSFCLLRQANASASVSKHHCCIIAINITGAIDPNLWFRSDISTKLTATKFGRTELQHKRHTSAISQTKPMHMGSVHWTAHTANHFNGTNLHYINVTRISCLRNCFL